MRCILHKLDSDNVDHYGMLNLRTTIAAKDNRCNMNVTEEEKNFAKLVDKVYVEGVSIDLERDDKVIARLTPAEPRSPLTVGELHAFLRNLPSLGDDAHEFARDVRAIRAEFPATDNVQEFLRVPGLRVIPFVP